MTNLVNIDRGKHILEHGGHELEAEFIPVEVVEDEKRMMKELRCIHAGFP